MFSLSSEFLFYVNPISATAMCSRSGRGLLSLLCQSQCHQSECLWAHGCGRGQIAFSSECGTADGKDAFWFHVSQRKHMLAFALCWKVPCDWWRAETKLRIKWGGVKWKKKMQLYIVTGNCLQKIVIACLQVWLHRNLIAWPCATLPSVCVYFCVCVLVCEVSS